MPFRASAYTNVDIACVQLFFCIITIKRQAHIEHF